MALSRCLLLWALAQLSLAQLAQEEDGGGASLASDEDDEGAAESDERDTPSSVYIMEHGFLEAGGVATWQPRGTLVLSGTAGQGGFEARLSDAMEFVELRSEIQAMMVEAAEKKRFYAVRMYSPELPKRTLQAAIPASILADRFEDWHDILEVAVGSTSTPVSLAYRVKHTLGLSLFDHTQVHISEPRNSGGPVVKPGAKQVDGSMGAPPKAQADPGPTSLIRKYWWVGLIVMVLVSQMTAPEPEAGGKASGGGGGGGGAARK